MSEIESDQHLSDRLGSESIPDLGPIDCDLGDLSIFRLFVTEVFKVVGGNPVHG
jgi:hypothetical protein